MNEFYNTTSKYRVDDKSLALPGRKQATATENFDIIYNKPTRCNSGSSVFVKNYRYALHVSDALCVHLQEHYKHNTARFASCSFIIYYRLAMHGNSNRHFWVSYILFIIIIGGILVLFIYIYIYIYIYI